MKFFRFATVSTLALTAATMGAADNNEASLLQNGTLNSALVEQNQGVSNTALLDQAGASNDSTITQTGDGNLAGQVRSRTGSVRILNAMQQAGDNNILDIEQTANNGQIGNLDRGVAQSGDRNTATVLQTGNGARLGSIQQIGGTGATRSQNNLDVVQGGGNGNFILNISQTKQGARNRANEMTVVQDGRRNLLGQRPTPAGTGLLQDGRANTMTVTQNGNDNGSGGVRGETGAFTGAAALAAMVQQGSASQVGTRNRLEYTATGDNNLFGSIQNGSDNSASIASDGSRNEAASLQLGDGNTVYIFQGTFPIIARFGVPLGFPTASDDNIAGTYVDGDDNLVGTFQLNNANTASSTVIGNQNELLTTQLGDNNNSDSSVAGDRNTVTTSQSGSAGPSNASSVSVDGRRGQGNANTVFIQQAGLNASNIDIFGDRSEVTVNQLGTNTSEVSIKGRRGLEGKDNVVNVLQTSGPTSGSMNNSNVSISGDRNFVEVSQSGTNSADLMIGGRREGDNNTVNIVQTAGTVAGQNVITATIYGDDNNTNLGFTGGTLTVSSSLWLNPGDMFQSGSGNTITLTVGDRLGESSGNAFAFSQNGVGNEIIGSISQGGANQVAVVQAGTANSTNFNQIGSFNSLGVTQ